MKKKKSTNKNNTEIEQPTKKVSAQTDLKVYEEEFRSTKTLLKRAATNRYVEELAERMLKTIQTNKKIRSIKQYLIENEEIAEKTYYQWIKKYEILTDLHGMILTILAARNEEIVKDDYKWIHFNMPAWDKYVFVENAYFWADVKNRETAENTKAVYNFVDHMLKGKIEREK